MFQQSDEDGNGTSYWNIVTNWWYHPVDFLRRLYTTTPGEPPMINIKNIVLVILSTQKVYKCIIQ